MQLDSSFQIREHTFSGQHIREYPGALAHSQEDIITLHAKSYTPRAVARGEEKGQLTVIGFHANGFHKEVMEPFWEDLYNCLKRSHGITIGSIWIADQAAQGKSSELNADSLGNDPHWFDHSRDVLAMVNTFRKHMKRPIIAMGHSMGGTQAVGTAIFHPRLFEAIVLIDPALTRTWAPTLQPMLQYSLRKPESFPSHNAAEAWVRSNPLFKNWGSRVLQTFLDTGFRLDPTSTDGRWVPTTAPLAEQSTLVRANPEHIASAEGKITATHRYTHPDVDPTSPLTGPVYNPFTRQAWAWLPNLRPPTLFLLGKGSQICNADELAERTRMTGTRPGGSGGAEAQNVASITVPGGHFLPMTNAMGTAEKAAEWIDSRIQKLQVVEKEFWTKWNEQSVAEKQRLRPEVKELLMKWNGKPWEQPHRGTSYKPKGLL